MPIIVHLVRTFGHGNQLYTKSFLESISIKDISNEHVVVCNSIMTKSQLIKVISSSKENKYIYILKNFSSVMMNLCDRNFLKYFGHYSLKRKINILIKWLPLINLKPSLVHIHHLHIVNIELLKFLKSNQIKLIISFRGRDLLVNVEDVNKLKVLLSKVFEVDHIHVISEYLKKKVIQLNIDRPVTVIYRGIDSKLSEFKNEKKDEVKINQQPIRMISIGRLVWEKGHVYLIESLYRLIRTGHEITLDIYGEGILEEFLKFRVCQLNLDKNVNFKGHVSQKTLRDNYKNYDLAVQPSLSEALSNSLLELTLFNIPCVISNVGGMMEIIHDNMNGVVFDINNPLELDDSIFKALKLDIEKIKYFNSSHMEKFYRIKEIENFIDLYSIYV